MSARKTGPTRYPLSSIPQQAGFMRPFLYLSLLMAAIAPGRCDAQPTRQPSDLAHSVQACSDANLLESEPFAAACYWRSFLVDEKGYIPVEAKLQAYQHVQKMRAMNRASSQAGANDPGPWTELGPGNLGGRIRSVVLHPTDPGTIWVGSVSGGVFKTTNGGSTWSATDDFMANLAIGSLVLDSSDTTSNTLYAGTGEGFFPDVDSKRGAGIFRTNDGGAHWTQLGGTGTSDFWYVNRLALSNDGNALLAATGTGLWLNPNVKSGSTWTRVIGSGKILYVAFNPLDNTKAVASSAGSAWHVSAASDARLTTSEWVAAAFNPGFGFFSPPRVELAYAPSNPTIVYASVDQNDGDLYRSTDGGSTYTRVNTGNHYFQQGDASQGWYDNALWVDPTNEDTLVVGGIDLWISFNGGGSLNQISDWEHRPASPHADQHVIVSAPAFNGGSNRTVFVGNDGGLYKTDDITTAGNDPDRTHGWLSLSTNLPITQFYSGAVHPATGRVTGGSQDNGTSGYTGGFNDWAPWIGGDGGTVAADPSDSSGNTWYGEYIYLEIIRTTTGFNRESLAYIPEGGTGCGALTDAGDRNTALFIAPFLIDPNDADTMLAGGTSLWRSTNIKDDIPCWSSIKGPVLFGLPSLKISAIAVANGNSNAVWVGYENGAVSKTSNGTISSPTWSSVDNNLWNNPLPNRKITRIAVDPKDSDDVYVTFGGYSSDNIWRTTDGGETWANISGGLPAVPIFSVAIKPDNSNWLYVGTDLGIFDTENALAPSPSWSANDGPANVPVTELFWRSTNTSTHTLFAATHGRGMWKTTNPLPGGTATATLTATPASGPAPLTTNLTAKVSGSAGTVNYTFWWNCSASVTTVQQGITQCGDPTNPAIGAKFDTTSTTTFTVTTAPYANPGTYKALVIIERGSGAAVATADLVVDPSGLSLSLIPTPSSGVAPLDVSLKATVVGGTGSIDYSIWWDCDVAGTDLALLSAQCGWLPPPVSGQCQSNTAGYMCKGLTATQVITPWKTYTTSGSYTPKVVVERSGQRIARRSTVTVSGVNGSIPTPLTPGYTSGPGELINSLIPTLTWGGVAGADVYGVYVSKYPYGESNLVFESETVPGWATSWQLPPGTLIANERYRWNIRAMVDAYWGGFSSRLYFETAACSYSISPTQTTTGPSGGSFNPAVAVTTGTGCSWTWESHAPDWLSMSSGFCSTTGSSSGNGSVTPCVTTNSGASRTGTFTIAGQTFTVVQGAAGCSYETDVDKRTFLPNGGTGTVAVTGGAGCDWNSASNVPWITIVSGQTGSGPGTVTLNVAANTSTASRSGDIFVAGKTIKIYQGGVGCSYSISPTQTTTGPSGGSFNPAVAVTTGTGCSWTWESHAPDWLSMSSGFCSTTGSSSGNGSITPCVTTNSGASRTGTITVAGYTFTVVQGAAGCSYATDVDKRTFLPNGGIGTVAVTGGTGCDWNSASNVSWITIVSGQTGSGPGTVILNVAANTSTTSRSGDIFVAGKTIKIYQGGVGCSYSISPTQTTTGPSGGSFNPAVAVNTGTGCSWTWESHAPDWLSMSSGFCSTTGSSSGNGSINPCVTTNSGASRTGTITIAGHTFTVVQNGSSCTPVAAPTASNNGPICAGDPLQLFATSVPGGTYSWTGPDGFVSTAQNPTIPSATMASAGSYSVAATVGGCTSAVGTTLAVVNPTPASPLITAPSIVTAGTTGLSASAVLHAGSTYTWSITNGTITSGNGTEQITFIAGVPGPLTLSLIETNSSSCPSSLASVSIEAVPPSDLDFYTLVPCRLVDTRKSDGPLGGPALQPNEIRSFALTGTCGIPANAKALSVNITAAQPVAPGNLRLYPGDLTNPPLVSSINFRAGQTIANNAFVKLSENGTGTILVKASTADIVHFVLDVTGYFE